jgi:hypothetical protein
LGLRVLIPGLLIGLLTLGAAQAAHAATLTEDTRALRDSVVLLTRDYEGDFGSRVTAEQRAELASMGAQARRHMTGLVAAVRRAERTQRPADWRNARTLHSRALATTKTRFEQAASILRPHLTLGEPLRAYSDYTSTLDDFQRLGERISAAR